jgi:TatD DNase family protein
VYPPAHFFINIHTHHKPSLSNEFALRNAYLNNLHNSSYPLSCGLHPWYAQTITEEKLHQTLSELTSNPMVWAIGEIGLDRSNGPDIAIQIRMLEVQLMIAEQNKLPVIWHVVRSFSDILPFIKNFRVQHIIHQFNGNLTEAKRLIDMGCLLSFGKNLFNYKSDDVLRRIPTSAILLETDTASHLHIGDIYEKAAEIRKTEMTVLKAQVFYNFEQIFGKHRQ